MIRLTAREPQQLRDVEFEQTKTSLHEEMVESLDLAAVGLADTEDLRREVRELAQVVLKQRRLKLTSDDETRMLDGLVDEVF